MSITGATIILPPAYDLVWSIVPIVLLVPLVCALVSIARHRDGLTGLALVGWLLLVVVVQLVGPILWFAIGRPHTRDRTLANASEHAVR
ncbi:MAG: hypothetical protein ACXIUP_02355 [Microcella sp.]